MGPSHAAKGGRRWRYYVSRAILTGRKLDAGSVTRVSAAGIEKQVFDATESVIESRRSIDGFGALSHVGVSGRTVGSQPTVGGHQPSRRIICVSYSGDLSRKHSNDFRALIESHWYRAAFPATRIGAFKDSETEIEFSARGFRLATSVGGTLTGRGGDIIVIDDPLKPDDALSETKRSAANQWFANTLLSRLDDKRSGAIVIVMQRVHMDDLTGFVTG